VRREATEEPSTRRRLDLWQRRGRQGLPRARSGPHGPLRGGSRPLGRRKVGDLLLPKLCGKMRVGRRAVSRGFGRLRAEEGGRPMGLQLVVPDGGSWADVRSAVGVASSSVCWR
jgi:hypothetical protein